MAYHFNARASLSLSEPAPSVKCIALHCSSIMHSPSVWGFNSLFCIIVSSLFHSVVSGRRPFGIRTQPVIRYTMLDQQLCRIIQKCVGDYKTPSSAREAHCIISQYKLCRRTQQLFFFSAKPQKKKKRIRERDHSLLPDSVRSASAAVVLHNTYSQAGWA